MSRAYVHQFSVSLDGFGTGEGLTRDEPFGHAGERLHEWMFATRWGREMLGEPGGTGGVDDAFLRLFAPAVGAEIMGAGKFGHPGWHEDPEWKGWWGPNPPFHTPVVVLTHHTRPVQAKDHRQFLNRHIMYYLVICTLHKTGIDITKRNQTLRCQTRRKRYGMLFSNTHVERAVRHSLHHQV